MKIEITKQFSRKTSTNSKQPDYEATVLVVGPQSEVDLFVVKLLEMIKKIGANP